MLPSGCRSISDNASQLDGRTNPATPEALAPGSFPAPEEAQRLFADRYGSRAGTICVDSSVSTKYGLSTPSRVSSAGPTPAPDCGIRSGRTRTQLASHKQVTPIAKAASRWLLSSVASALPDRIASST